MLTSSLAFFGYELCAKETYVSFFLRVSLWEFALLCFVVYSSLLLVVLFIISIIIIIIIITSIHHHRNYCQCIGRQNDCGY